MSPGKTVSIAGFPILEATQQDLATYLLSTLRRHKKTSLLFANSNFIVKCKPLLNRMRNEGVTIVNDGVGLDIAARLLRGRGFTANLNGTDFTPYLFRKSTRPLRVFLLGGRPNVVDQAANYVSHELGQAVVGYCDGYSGINNTAELIERINRSQAEVLLVALGNPLQEQWILDHRDTLDVDIVAGVGALFDFWSGNKSRAPLFVQKIRMEWFYRLLLEPRRLLRRYTVDMLTFFAYCFQYRDLSAGSGSTGSGSIGKPSELLRRTKTIITHPQLKKGQA